MTQTADLLVPTTRNAENKLVGGVCFAHFVSHFYIMLLAPLFVFVREDYGASYTELGLALTAFNVVSTVVQTPAGFLVDRVSARLVLVIGLLLSAGAFAIAGWISSFWVFVVMFGVAGLGNTAFHPAGYALLSQHVAPEWLGRVFSFHTFAGMAGNAATPPTLLYLYSVAGWRGAFLAAAALGLVAGLVLLWQGEPPPPVKPSKLRRSDPVNPSLEGWRLLVSPPILVNLAFFILLSFCTGGLNNYLVVGLGALHATPLTVANTALTGLLTMSAVGVLVGGILAGRTARHGVVAACGLVATATVCTLVGLVDFDALALVLMMATAGVARAVAVAVFLQA